MWELRQPAPQDSTANLSACQAASRATGPGPVPPAPVEPVRGTSQSVRRRCRPAAWGPCCGGRGGGGTGSPGEASAGLSGHPWATHDWPVARNWAKSRGPLSMPDRRGIIGRTARTGQPSFSPLSLLALAAVASSGKGWQLARQTRNKRETAWSTPNRHKLTAPPSRAPGPSRSVPGHLARTRRCRFVG